MPQAVTSPATSLRTPSLRSVVLALGLAVSALPALAAGGSGGSGSSGGGASGGSSGGGGGSAVQSPDVMKGRSDLTTCPKGQVWSVKKKACMKRAAGLFTDDELTDYAFALAKAKRYDEALDTLDQVKGAPTPKALNYRGYATRKLGRTDEGIGYYLKSVAMDPQYAQVREYLGEAYVIQGKTALATEQLQAIEAICGSTACEEYEDLHKAIETGEVEG